MYIIAHGGAGSPPEKPAGRQDVLDSAVTEGQSAATPLKAVCATVRVLEADPQFNAGVGSAVQSDGRIRTDAGVMTAACGSGAESVDRSAGAACAMPDVCHAVSVARAVLEATPHVLLAGERAVEFAATQDVETGIDCWTDVTRQRWADSDAPDSDRDAQLDWVRERFGATDPGGASRPQSDERTGETDHDTVGAVATDGDRVAAATSTGGRWGALAGRVGDVPQIGAGLYASAAGAASATGAGEAIARRTLSREAVRRLESGTAAPTAATRAIDDFDAHTDANAGVIVIDADGRVGEATNSPAMQTARTAGPD